MPLRRKPWLQARGPTAPTSTSRAGDGAAARAVPLWPCGAGRLRALPVAEASPPPAGRPLPRQDGPGCQSTMALNGAQAVPQAASCLPGELGPRALQYQQGTRPFPRPPARYRSPWRSVTRDATDGRGPGPPPDARQQWSSPCTPPGARRAWLSATLVMGPAPATQAMPARPWPGTFLLVGPHESRDALPGPRWGASRC
jgi:hypothetical protein